MSAAANILVLAGGTGGHVYPALAVALNLRERGYAPHWVGTSRGLEARVVPEANIPLHALPMRGVRGKSLAQKVQALVLLAYSLLLSLGLVLRHRPRLVIGMGGYASVPAAFAAWLLRRPLLLQEQNAVAGSANRFLSRFARCVTTGFPNVLTAHKDARYLGNPVREDLVQVPERAPWAWTGDRPLQVLVLGGSLGARPLNEAAPAFAAKLGERCVWRHQCGILHEDSVRAAWAGSENVNAEILPFIEDMAAAYAWADLVICRAGALTVAELAVTGRPSILVPLPHAIDDHQTANARFLAEAGAGLLLPQTDMESALVSTLSGLLDDPETLRGMARSALECARPNATRDIADCGVELMS